MTDPSRPNRIKTTTALGGAAAGCGAIALCLSIIMPWEGKRNDPYRDIVGVLTVCYGETQGPMRRYSDAECSDMLRRRVERDYAAPVLRCVPGFATRPEPYAASISLAYNIGAKAFCGSTAARRFNAGDWRGGCNAFLMWSKAGGRVVSGLVNRRRAEQGVCLKGV